MDEPLGAMLSCTTYLHLQGTKGKKPVKRRSDSGGSLVVLSVLTTRDDNNQSLEYSPSMVATSSATWRRPRSVKNIMGTPPRAGGRNDDDKLLLQPQNGKAAAHYEEDISLSQSSDSSCGQEWDLKMHAHQVRRNDDVKRSKNKSNQHRCLVTPDLATAWVQMASQEDTKTDPKNATTTNAGATATTAAPTILHVAHRSAMVPNELDVEAHSACHFVQTE
jgi:hypothetical protein